MCIVKKWSEMLLKDAFVFNHSIYRDALQWVVLL